MNVQRLLLYLTSAILCLPLLSPAATNDTPQIAAQYHFAGAKRLAATTNLLTLNRIRALPSTAAFQKLVIDNVSAVLSARLGLAANAPAMSSPLLADLLQTESLGAFGPSSANLLDFVVALQSDTNRTHLWQDIFARALGGTVEKFTAEGFDGWRWNRAASGSLWIIPARDWLLVGRGDALLPLQVQYLQAISRQGRPGASLKENLLEADVDLPALAPWLPDWMRFLRPARLKITLAAEADNLRTTAQVIYPEPIPWNSQPWQIPTNLIRSPLLSFTAGQDVAAFLNPAPAFVHLDNNPLTNQFCAWALGTTVIETYMEWPVPNASNALETLGSQAPAAFNADLKRFDRGEVIWAPRLSRLVLSKRGIVAPYVEAAPAQAGQFLLLSMIPLSLANKPAPAELWAQIKGRADLVYYDWEATGPRLQQWRLLGDMQLRASEAGNDDFDAMIIKEKWLNGIGTPKGNSVTEITRGAPNQLSFVRASPLGFTGIELVLLSDWICAMETTNSPESPPSKSPIQKSP